MFIIISSVVCRHCQKQIEMDAAEQKRLLGDLVCWLRIINNKFFGETISKHWNRCSKRARAKVYGGGGWMGWQRVRNPPHQPLSTEWIFLQLKWHIEHISPANMWVFVCKIFSASKRNAPSLTIRWNNKWPFVFRFHVIYFPSMPPAQCIFRSTLSLPAYSSISKSNHFLFLPRYSMRRASEWKRDAKQWNLWYISCCTQIIGLVYSNKKSLFFWSVTYYIELHSKI